MRQWCAFFRKESLEWIRSGRILIFAVLALLFGIMSPALAKLTPWIMEMAADSLADSGLTVAEVTVDALTSWGQFYKNIPILLVIVLLLCSGSFTMEYQKGTLINMITRGLARWKILTVKSAVLLLAYSFVYWGCFGITYGYNEYFWDNGIAQQAGLAAVCYYVMGLWLVSLLVLFSTVAKGNMMVILGAGAVFGICYLLSVFEPFKAALPVSLSFGMQMLLGEDAGWKIPMLVSICWSMVNLGLSVIIFNRKQMC